MNGYVTGDVTTTHQHMQLDQQSPERDRTTVTDSSRIAPTAFDVRVVALVAVLAAIAASVNVPYGGLEFAVVAFVLLGVGGIGAHVVGERRLRRLTDDLVARWIDAGGQVEDVTRSTNGRRTEWTVHTPEGPITVGGLAFAPISKVSLEHHGVGDTVSVADATRDLDRLAAEWYQEVFTR